MDITKIKEVSFTYCCLVSDYHIFCTRNCQQCCFYTALSNFISSQKLKGEEVPKELLELLIRDKNEEKAIEKHKNKNFQNGG